MLLDVAQDLAHVPLGVPLDLGAEAHRFFIHALFDDLVKTVERTAADKEDVRGIHVDEFLLRMLASAVGRNIGDRALQQLQKRLLHAFA